MEDNITANGPSKSANGRIAVVVVGEFARSPRMMYHSLSCANAGWKVDLVGFSGNPLTSLLANHPNVSQSHLFRPANPPLIFRKLSFLLFTILRVIFQIIQLTYVLLWKLQKPSLILVQTPPAVPVLPILRLVCFLRTVPLVIDWHNLGFTLLQCDKRPKPLVALYKFIERYFGCNAQANICVSDQMKEWLSKEWNIKAVVLHDHPNEIFQPCSADQTHSLFLGPNRDLLIPTTLQHLFNDKSTPFTYVNEQGQICRKELGLPDSYALIVSSTSWTGDEDFSILLEALQSYDRRVIELPYLPKILAVITGDGPRREYYRKQIASMELKHVHIRTGYLQSHKDYATLLASAHLGISLHVSSSGIDLPMKVVDMFGCKLPVLALDFPALPELVQHNVNGMAIPNNEKSIIEMEKHMEHLLTNPQQLKSMKQKITIGRWNESWNSIIKPLLQKYPNIYIYFQDKFGC